MKPADILQRLVEFYREKAALERRHEAAARVVSQYDRNNTYQYIIAREMQHLGWLSDAIAEVGGTVPDVPAAEQLPTPRDDAAMLAAIREDARSLDHFVENWRRRSADISNARHRLMLQLALGETLEHARLLRQAADGTLDLLGRRTGGERTGGVVLPARWVE